MLKNTMSFLEAADHAVIRVYQMDLGREFTISQLYDDVQEEFNFNKKKLSVISKLLLNTGLAVKTGEYARTYSEGRVAGMAAVYMRCAK